MEGAPHTAKRNLGVPPAPVYKEEEEAGGQEGRAKGGVLLGLLVQVRFGPPMGSRTI